MRGLYVRSEPKGNMWEQENLVKASNRTPAGHNEKGTNTATEWTEENVAWFAEFQREKTPEEERAWSMRLLGRSESDWYEPSGTRIPFFGQEEAMSRFQPFLKRAANFPHTLLMGPSGIGKTHLARWIADQRREMFDELLCPVKPEDIPGYGIVLLDEAHRQSHPEWLFPIMENATVTILAATTRPELLEPAFKTRFFLTLHLTRYSDEAMIELCKFWLPEVTDEVAQAYAGASAGNPRQMEQIVAVAREVGINEPALTLRACRITGDGLTDIHMLMLEQLVKANRPVGLSTLSSLAYTDEQTIREHERLLVEYELIELRSNGRMATRKAKRYLELLEQRP